MKRQHSTHSDQNINQTGSPLVGEPVFLAVGKLRRPHGVQGEIQMEVLTDFPQRIRAGITLYVGEEHEPIKVAGVRAHDQILIMTLEGFDTPETVGRFRNQFVFVPTKSVPPLPEGQYYHHQLVGMTVVDEHGQLLGTLTDVLETGANDVYAVSSPEGEEILLPVIENVIIAVSLEKREIIARPPAWL